MAATTVDHLDCRSEWLVLASVLITGSNGLIGRRLRMMWPTGWIVYAPSRADADLLSPGAFAAVVRDLRPDVMVHLAWCASGIAGYRASPDNARWVRATKEAVEAGKAHGMRAGVVGTIIDDRTPTDAYSAAKSTLRTALQPAIADGTVTWFRPHYVFDPDHGRPGVLRGVSAAIRTRRPIELIDPSASHDFVHVVDVAAAILRATEKHLDGLVDIGSGRLRTVAELVDACGAAWVPAPHGPAILHDDRVADISRLTGVGWVPAESERFFRHA